MILTEWRDTVAVLRLDRGVINALDLQLVSQLADSFRKIRNSPEVHSLVVGSSNDKFFSIGFDIPTLLDLSRKDFRAFYQAFNQVCMDLYTLPKPTVAAVTGHALAGGCILALCCDYRFIGEGRKLMGLNEIELGVPVPYAGDCILRSIVGAANAREIMNTGEFYHPEAALRMGMVDEVLPLDQVAPKSMEKARLLGSLPCEAFATIKRNRVEMIETLVMKHAAEKELSFVECWFSDETQERLRRASEKFQRR